MSPYTCQRCVRSLQSNATKSNQKTLRSDHPAPELRSGVPSLRPFEVAKIKSKIKIKINRARSRSRSQARCSTNFERGVRVAVRPVAQAKKTRVLGGESGLRPLGVKQRYAVPEHLYRRATWGGCAAPTLQVLVRFGAVPAHIGRFLNRFGIRRRSVPPASHGRMHRETLPCLDDPCNFPQVRHNKPLRLSSSPSHAERTS